MPPSERPPADQARIDALVRHGVGAAAADAVVRAGQALGRLTRAHGVEVAATLDADSGVEPAPIVLGTRRSVDVASRLRALTPGWEYVMLHTHPDSESFSWRDAVWLIARPVRVLVVVGRNGTWYVLSRNPAGPPASAREGAAAVQAEYDQLSPPGDPARTRGAVGRVARVREVSHQVWTNLAANLGFR